MAIKQNRIAGCCAIYFKEQKRRSIWREENFELALRNILSLNPLLDERHSALHMAVLPPLLIELGRLVWDFDITRDSGENLGIPELIDVRLHDVGLLTGISTG